MTAPDHTLAPFKNHLHQRRHPYMRKSADERFSPFHRRLHPTDFVSGLPRAAYPFRIATRT
jgi:hypothetical protein